MIPRTTAEVAFQRMADVCFCRLRIMLQQIGGRHDHARRTKTALQTMLVPERFLNRMEMAVGGQAFDGGDLAAVGLDGEHGAGFHGLAVERHSARAADGGLAADMRPGVPGYFAQIMNEQHARLDFVGMRLSVDPKCDLSFHGGSVPSAGL